MNRHIDHRLETICLDAITTMHLPTGRTWSEHETDCIRQRRLVAIHAYAGPIEIRIRTDGHLLRVAARRKDQLEGLLHIDATLDDALLATRLRTAIRILTNHWPE